MNRQHRLAHVVALVLVGVFVLAAAARADCPEFLGSVDTPVFARGVAVSGGHAYVADTHSLRVINVSTPSTPVEVGLSYTPNPAEDVALSAGYVAVAVNLGGLAVYEDCSGALFADGFESGDTSAWSATVP